jgi:hypothetical protein
LHDDEYVTFRVATPDDARTLRRLSELDSAPPLTGRVFLAEVDGVALAAVSLETGPVTADPFRLTAHLVRMLRLRRDQLTRQGGRRPLQSLLRRSRADARGIAWAWRSARTLWWGVLG